MPVELLQADCIQLGAEDLHITYQYIEIISKIINA